MYESFESRKKRLLAEASRGLIDPSRFMAEILRLEGFEFDPNDLFARGKKRDSLIITRSWMSEYGGLIGELFRRATILRQLLCNHWQKAAFDSVSEKYGWADLFDLEDLDEFLGSELQNQMQENRVAKTVRFVPLDPSSDWCAYWKWSDRGAQTHDEFVTGIRELTAQFHQIAQEIKEAVNPTDGTEGSMV